MSNNFVEILISSGVIVTAITGVFNLLTLFSNNRALKSMEKQKFNNGITQHRYIQLHKYLEEIALLEEIIYDICDEERTKTTVEKATKRFHLIEKKFVLIKPLLDKQYRDDINSVLNNVTIMSNQMTEHIYNHTNIDFQLKDLLLMRQKFEEKVILNTQDQIQKLLN